MSKPSRILCRLALAAPALFGPAFAAGPARAQAVDGAAPARPAPPVAPLGAGGLSASPPAGVGPGPAALAAGPGSAGLGAGPGLASIKIEPVRTEPPGPVAAEPRPSPADAKGDAGGAKPEKKGAHWYEKLRVRGYAQFRYNRLFASNDDYVNAQGDKTIGKLNGFSLRRARLIVSGDVHERLSVYLQTDAANSVGDLTHVVAMRDWYADVFLDDAKEARFRVGQSKVPYGFENMQSSQNRVPLDRSDGINTGAPNERDIGVFFYWAPAEIRARFKHLVDAGLKGSGDYGVVGVGVYNGQGTNLKEKNDNLHAVARVTYPFLIGDQILEVGGGGYVGKYVVAKSENVGGPEEFRDVRAGGAVVLYPQPFGFQAEYNVGIGPELDASRGLVREGRPRGGYAMVMFRAGAFLPYARASIYDGGKKHETDAVKYKVREIEAGVEWRPFEALELTAAYVQGRRTLPKGPYDVEDGRLVRLQLQFNY